MTYDRNPRYVHPYIESNLNSILQSITASLPAGYSCKLLSGHRKPEDQFTLFKQGRAFTNGAWRVVDRSRIVTNLDGYTKRSRHNYLPCTAIDIGIFDSNGKYQTAATYYRHVANGKAFGLDWGGDWVRFVDMPHLEIPSAMFYQRSIEKDSGIIWQNYLKKAGKYTAALDGIFGPKSLAALKAATGENERNLKAWDLLYQAHGKPEPAGAVLFG